MADNSACSVCVKALEQNVTPDDTYTKTYWAELLDVSEASVRRHFKHVKAGFPSKLGDERNATVVTPGKHSESSSEDTNGRKEIEVLRTRKVTMDDARQWLRDSGDNPDDFNIAIRSIVYGPDLYSNKMSAWPKAKNRPEDLVPAWPVVQQADPVQVVVPDFAAAPLVGQWKTAIATADHQVGFRADQPFHDDEAISIASQIIAIEQPDQIVYCGDFLDLPAQGKYEQEAAFAFNTQQSLNRGHEILATDRELAPNAKIVLVEGNHDRRMQKFVSNNAMAAFGLKQANVPDAWPVMSLPYLLRLDELDVEYIDAYPAGMWWINDNLRAIHGDKVRSGGSTASAYTNQLPHVSTIFGHTHRAEVQSRTTMGPGNTKIRSMSINPGAMCRVDGEVPSVNGSTGVDGKAALHWEDWQQGLAVVRYKDSGEFFVNLVQIEDGVTVYERQELWG